MAPRFPPSGVNSLQNTPFERGQDCEYDITLVIGWLSVDFEVIKRNNTLGGPDLIRRAL